MLILFDHSTPSPLRAYLKEHAVTEAPEHWCPTANTPEQLSKGLRRPLYKGPFVKQDGLWLEQHHAGVAGRFAESVIQTGKRQAFPESQVKVGGIVDGQPVPFGQAEHTVI